MIKVKIIRETCKDYFEDCINEFIAEHDVRDIKYQMASPKNEIVYSAMIIYEEF